jgi:mRNA interferase MazF
MHDHLRTVLVAPMTTAGREAPFRIGVTHGGRKGLILLYQVRAVDKTRLTKKLGVIPATTLTSTLRTLQEVFAE